MPYTKFCYVCKKVIVANNEDDFRASGHVSDRYEAQKKYRINVSRLPKNSALGI